MPPPPPLLLPLLLLSFPFPFPFPFPHPLLVSARPAPDQLQPDERPPASQSVHANAAWASFHRLLDLRRGSHVSGLSALKRYLARFGYLTPKPGPADLSDSFDARLESAVLRYQASLGLPVTGQLDASTVSQLVASRCGVPDSMLSESNRTGVAARFTFFPGKPRWAGSKPLRLTYAVSPDHTIDYVSREEVAAAIRRAFARWARVIPVRFAEVGDYGKADVKVAFYSGDHGDGEPFDGALGILAHAFAPDSGRLHLDAAERWAVDLGRDASDRAVDLESVATHEIGHVLGLGHSTMREAVMYPSLSPRTRKVELRVDDIEGAQVLYGSNPNFQLSQLVESEMSGARRNSIAGARDEIDCKNWIRLIVTTVIMLIA